MPQEKNVEAARHVLQFLLPQFKLPGLTLNDLGYDFVRQSYTVSFGKDGKQVKMVLPAERVSSIMANEAFTVKRLKAEIYQAFGIPE